MATTKRMFSNDIVGSDAFLEMPSTTQALYFHLGMRCDDDGFVNPNVTMRMIGANKNDLDVLILKKFLLVFKNGVVVIKHHRINNNWDSRDCRRTLYTEELKQLFIKENNAYTFDSKQGEELLLKYPKKDIKIKELSIPTETRRKPDGRIEENRIEENRREKKRKEKKVEIVETSSTEVSELIKSFESINPASKKFYSNITQRDACQNLINTYGFERVKIVIEKTLPKTNTMEFFPTITTPLKLWEKWSDLESKIMQHQSKKKELSSKYKIAF